MFSHAMQLVGSVTRMPSLCRAIKDFFGGREPGRALNSEECIAKGCALAAAIISPTFKVRDFAVIDACVFPVNLSWATHAAAVDADAMDSGAADSAEKKGDGDIFKQYGALPVTYVLPPRCSCLLPLTRVQVQAVLYPQPAVRRYRCIWTR